MIPTQGSGLTAILVVTMLVSTFQLYSIGVLSPDIIAELDLSRGEIGLLGALNAGVGALIAPKIGVWTDRLGGRRALIAVIGFSAFGMFLTAAASGYWMLGAASLVSGIPMAGGNPATNRMIGQHFTFQRRGSVAGWKQSGVQFGIFLSGLTMPTAARWIGWREAFGVAGGLTAVVMVIVAFTVPEDPVDETHSMTAKGEGKARLPPIIYRLAIYGFLLGVVGGGIGRFLPLFAVEDLGFSPTTAGLVVAFAGALGIVSRLGWGVAIERGADPRRSLVGIALGGAGVGILLTAASNGVPGLIWVSTALSALTVTAWNVVGMLTIISDSPPKETGRASGLVMLGFLGGLSVGPPLVGAIVDATDSYSVAWLVMILFALAAAPAPGVDQRRENVA